MITIHNVETGEIVEREMNAEELAQYAADEQTIATEKSEQLALAKIRENEKTAAEAKLAKLGLTVDDLKALF